jgi:hypothetical protein
MIRTSAAVIHLYESMSKWVRPAAIKARLNRGENPNDADEMAA